MIKYFVFSITMLIFGCQQKRNIKFNISKGGTLTKVDTITKEVSIHDTIGCDLNDFNFLELKIKEELMDNKQYKLNIRLNNGSLDSIFILKLQSGDMRIDNYYIRSIPPHGYRDLALHFHAGYRRSSKLLVIYRKTGKTLIRLIVRAKKNE